MTDNQTINLHNPILNEINSNNDKITTIKCTCGKQCGSLTMYHHHIECCHSNSLPPFDPSGWPIRFFKSIPYISQAQRGCVARNDIYDHIQYVVIWLKRDKNNILQYDLKLDKTIILETLIKILIDNYPIEPINNNNHDNNNYAITLGFSSSLWYYLTGNNNVKKFETKKSYKTNEILLPSDLLSDIFIMVKSNNNNKNQLIVDNIITKLNNIIYKYENINGNKYENGKDYTGFIDGTKNNDYNLRLLSDDCIILPTNITNKNSNDDKDYGSSYVYASKFQHNLKKFKSLSTNDKSGVIGRKFNEERVTKAIDGRTENPRTGIDLKGHIFRAWGNMYRQSYPIIVKPSDLHIIHDHEDNKDDNKNDTTTTTHSNEKELKEGEEERSDKNTDEDRKGLFFVAFSYSLDEIDNALERMMGKWAQVSDGGVNTHDNLFKITQSIYNNYFYVPSLKKLQSLLIQKNEIHNKMQDWIDVRWDKYLNNIKLIDYPKITIEGLCKNCDHIGTFLTDPHSDFLYCYECRQITNKTELNL